MRGEHLLGLSPRQAECGLSPHARGTSRGAEGRSENLRFIPACAGNIPCSERGNPETPVYPRMRGEHEIIITGLVGFAGLSPHARGTSSDRATGLKFRRFIPACAGNISRFSCRSASTSVYPRMRGEHVTSAIGQPHTVGLSPHARGTFLRLLMISSLSRFIPACAGNITSIMAFCLISSVYPRMRGEHEPPTSGRSS